MAKKVERLKVEDDTGFDADLDFGSLDFDSEIDGLMDDDLTSDNRTPVAKALSATLEAAGDGVICQQEGKFVKSAVIKLLR